MEFRKGDRIRVKSDAWGYKGKEGTIDRIDCDDTVGVELDGLKGQGGDIVRTVDGVEREVIEVRYVKDKFSEGVCYRVRGFEDTIIEELLELVRRKGEKKKEILDKTEKKYLYNIIRPFKDRVRGMCKMNFGNKSYITIDVGPEHIDLPLFKKGTMYAGMKEGKGYTLKELGL